MVRKKSKKNINGKDSERFVKIRLITVNNLLVSILMILIYFANSLFISCESAKVDPNLDNNLTSNIQMTEKLCTDFAIKMHSSLVTGDTNFINSYLDWEQLTDFSLDSIGSISEISNHLKINYSVGKDLCRDIEAGGHLRFVTYYQNKERHFIVLRLFHEPQTVNYLEFELGTKGNSLMIKDIYDFNKSRLFSSWISNYIMYYQDCEMGWEFQVEKDQQLEKEVLELISAGDLSSAYTVLKTYDSEFQKTELYEDLEQSVILESDNIKVVVPGLKKKLANISIGEKGRSLTMFYLNAYAEKYNDALINLINLEKEVGEDGVLYYLQGNLYYEMGQWDKALQLFNQALSYETEIFSFHLAKTKTLIEQTNFVAAVEALLVLDDFFTIHELDWDTEFAQFPSFAASSEYQEWKKRLSQ